MLKPQVCSYSLASGTPPRVLFYVVTIGRSSPFYLVDNTQLAPSMHMPPPPSIIYHFERRPPVQPSSNIKLHYIVFTFCHDCFLNTTIQYYMNKYMPDIETITFRSWKIQPLLVVRVGHGKGGGGWSLIQPCTPR